MNTKTYITLEQYLEIERAAEYKSQYYEGEMFSMAGAREPHNMPASNALGELRSNFAPVNAGYMGATCEWPIRVYMYPDVVVVCGQPQFSGDHRDTLLNPGLLVEVLSPSTEAIA